MANRDEFLLGAEPVASPDTDGDGVSDAQERLDGTDPNDAGSNIHHADPTLATADPRGDLGQVSLEGQIVVDPAGAAPAGFSTAQSLGTGLDGKPIQADPHHLGVGDDPLLAGRMGSSIADVQRDPTVTGASTTVPEGHDPIIDTLGRQPGPGVSTQPVIRGGPGDTPPPGEMPSGSADPSNNPALVSGFVEDAARAAGHLAGAVGRELNMIGREVYNAPKTFVDEFVRTASEPYEPPPPPKADPPQTSVDPDAGGATVVTDADLTRVVAVHGGATDVVQGFVPTQVEGDAPPKQPFEFVRDPIEKDSSLSVTTATPTSSAQEISHTINPDAGFDPVRAPSGAPPAGGDGVGLYGSTSSAATAADSTAGSSTDAGGISVVGGGSSGGGIHSVSDAASGGDAILGLGTTAVASASGAAAGDVAGKGGFDSGDAGGGAHAGAAEAADPGVGSAAGDVAGRAGFDSGDAGGGAHAGAAEAADPGAGAVVDDGSGKAAFDSGDAGGGGAHGFGADGSAGDDSVPLDPVADAISTAHAVPFDEPAPTFSVLEVDDGLAIPDEADLDDGF